MHLTKSTYLENFEVTTQFYSTLDAEHDVQLIVNDIFKWLNLFGRTENIALSYIEI